MDSQRKSELEGKLEAIKELKAEYGIGSREAWNYLKVRQEYTQLADKIAQELKKEGLSYRPSYREISNLCGRAEEHLRLTLEDISEALAIKEKRFPRDQIVVPYAKILQRGTLAYLENQNFPDMDIVVNRWKFDYEKFIKNFYRKLRETEDKKKAFNIAFRGIINGNDSYIEDESGKRLTLNEILENERLLLTNEPKFIEDMEDAKIILERASSLLTWLAGESSDFSGVPFRVDDFQEQTIEELEFLYGCYSAEKNLYNRALREKSLGNIWIERRIALNKVITEADRKESPKEMIDDVLVNERKKLARTSRRLRGYISMEAPSVLIENGKELKAKRQYFIQAIISNRKWLEKVLSS
ncbi:hypothetical protein HYV50_01865 [Candidatus Pacearchaeota archaeon]|nr:hypothetical protein [Candidatus Pacearchaeota archaeon]